MSISNSHTKKEQPLVSIVIPCYNHANFVQETIKSVISQDYQNIELIIIDDGSRDSSVEKIQQMVTDCRKRFTRFEFRHRANQGLSSTLNEALEWCTGEFFAPVASDDLIKSSKITLQVNHLMDNPDCIGVFGAVELLKENGSKETIIGKKATYSFNDILLHNHNLPAPTQLLRLKNIRDIGGFKKELIIEDWSMWLFLTEHGKKLSYLNTVVSCYRRHEGNTSQQLDKMLEGRLQVVELFQHKKSYSLAKAKVFLIQAQDTCAVNRLEAIDLLLKAIKINMFCVFSRKFLALIFQILSSR